MQELAVDVLVVLYPYSTSNHNRKALRKEVPAVVLYPSSTSNHNRMPAPCID